MQHTIANWILWHAGDEKIEAVVIGEGSKGLKMLKSPDREFFDNQPINKVLSWEEAKLWLDYELSEVIADDFSNKYGDWKVWYENANPFYAWTATRVIFFLDYDSYMTIETLPRNPIACEPNAVG